MTVQVVFQESSSDRSIKKNDIYTYIKTGYYIDSYINGIQLLSDFNEDLTNEKWLMELINGLNNIGTKYEIIKIEL